MRSLLLLAAILLGSATHFVLVGLPAVEQLKLAREDLLLREVELARRRTESGLVRSADYARLLTERERAAARLRQRERAFAGDGAAQQPYPTLAEALLSCRQPSLGPGGPLEVALREAAAVSAEADATLAAVVTALTGLPGLALSTLQLADDQGAREIPDLPGVVERHVQLVLIAAPADAVACLESLLPSRGHGWPQLTVLSSSLRRLEPKVWGSDLLGLRGPPVRLSATLAVLLPAPTLPTAAEPER
ncbi:MAG: hypothetical protein ACT4PU_13380 [Planctomycetota bacterium]